MKTPLPILMLPLFLQTVLVAQNTSIANCVTTQAQLDLDINNVRTRILVGGDLWWDPIGQVPHYEVPKGSGKNAIFAGALWIGGFDQANQLLVAAQTYRQSSGNDFWGGPVSNSTGILNISQSRCADFDRLWKIDKSDVINFVQGGPATTAIQQWPGNGNLATGELPFLAPFFDANNDGVYNHLNGDYPYFNLSNSYPIDPFTQQAVCNNYLFGDQCIWWVFNDIGNIKTETNSNPIGIEVRSQAFAWSSANTHLNHATFYKYQIINRSSNTLDSTYVGLWCDSDLGNGLDDFVGCDVGAGLGYVYNGDPDDDGPKGYGLNPPCIGVDFLQGPLADLGDGIDNDRDNMIDEAGEQIIMSDFIYYENVNGTINGNPQTADDYYEYLSGSWLNGQPITYGGYGTGSGPGATTTLCSFMFPNNTDPLFSTPWTMSTAGIQPNDMRLIQSAGSFTMLPGSVNYMTTGVIYGRDTTGTPNGSLLAMQQADALIQSMFNNCFTTTSIPEQNALIGISLFPNPFHDECIIDLKAVKAKGLQFSAYTVEGKMIEQRLIHNGENPTFGKDYPSGTYLIHIRSKNGSFSSKIVKM